MIRGYRAGIRDKIRPAHPLPHSTREKTRPARHIQRYCREKVRPARHKPPILGHFSHAGRTFSRSHPPSDRAGRTFSRTGHSDVATVKPPSPLLAPEQRPLKSTTSLQPKNAPKTPISHPQRRWRFQLAYLTGPQRRWRFQLRPSLHEQRRQQFQTTTHLVCAHRLRHQQASMHPLPTKTRMQFDWAKSQ